MHRALTAVVLVVACSDPYSSPQREVAPERLTTAAPISDLQFQDDQLQAIATSLRRQAQMRGIETSSGRNRVERLLSLEQSVSGGRLALNRVNELVRQMTARDVSQWAALRQRAAQDFANREDDVGRRVRDLLARWHRHKTDVAFRYLSSQYPSIYMSSLEWERRFHEFVTESPIDAATWGWIVLREYARDARQQYGRADSETAYRFYVEFTGLSDGREARRIFSVPGIEIAESAGEGRSSVPRRIPY